MKKYLIIFGAGILTTIILFLLYKSFLSNDPAYRFGTDRAAVITQVQSLSRLETASFDIDQIIEIGTDYSALREFFFGDKLLLVAHGKVIAGFDLSELEEKDFQGSGSSIKLTLPPAEILSTNLDNSKTRVFDRDQGLFTKGDLNLEAEARQQAEESIRKAACEGGILEEATQNAQQQLTVIFKASGFEQVIIENQAINCS